MTLGTSFSTIGGEGNIHKSTFERWVPPPPNPPPMTAKEKHLAAVRRLEEPPPMSGCLAGAGGRTRLACWLGRPRPQQTACTAAVRRGRRRAWRPGCLAALLGERRLLGHAGRGGGYTRLCRAMDQGAALPRQDRWRGRALSRQRSALLVAAMSGQ